MGGGGQYGNYDGGSLWSEYYGRQEIWLIIKWPKWCQIRSLHGDMFE